MPARTSFSNRVLGRPFPFLKQEVQITTYCTKTQRTGFDAHIGCGECHALPAEFLTGDAPSGEHLLTTTLLFDLDGTLLSNPMQSFVPGYMKALSSYMAPIIDPDIFFQALMASTQRMLRNQDPDCYLKDVFDASFYSMLGLPQATIMPALEQFYVQVFPTLKSLTSPIPEAVRVVEAAFQQNDTLAIATNPLFPSNGNRAKTDWAGLSPEKYPFSIVPSYENAHFAKPNPAFLAELLARLGWPDGPVVMVGDDPDNDVRCGLELGLPVYHVNAPPGEINPAAGVVGAGSLDDLLGWIAEQPAGTA